MRRAKIAVLFVSAVLLAHSAVAELKPLTQRLDEPEIVKLRLLSEAWLKMQKYYYTEIPAVRFEKFFFRVLALAGTLLKEKDATLDENMDRLLYGSMEWMVAELRDPSDTFSQFIHYSFLKKMVRENLSSRFDGIGLEVERRDAQFLIALVYAGSSAAQAGVAIGDVLLKVNGEDITALALPDLEKKLSVPNGASVMLTLQHKDQTTPYEVTLVCTIIAVPSVVSNYYADRQIGYVRIAEFRDETGVEFANHLKNVIVQGSRGIVIDLRGNDGGNMEQAVEICDLFLPEKQLVCFFLKREIGRKDQYTTDPAILPGLDAVAILVDGNTGSAAEIMSGALKYYKKCVLVGTKTKGTGVLKNTIGLSDGSVLYLITSRTFLPDGTTFNDVGIQPDIAVENPEEQLNRAFEAVNSINKN